MTSPAPIPTEQLEELAARFLEHSLKPEEIGGEQREARINELLRWFFRYYVGDANPKWFTQHASELAYYIATSTLSLRQQTQPTREEGWIEAVATELARADLATMLPDVDVLSQVDVGPVVSAYTNKLRDAVAAAGLAAPIDAPAREAGGRVPGHVRDALEAAQYAAKNCIKEPGMKTVYELVTFALDGIPSPAEPAAHSLQVETENDK